MVPLPEPPGLAWAEEGPRGAGQGAPLTPACWAPPCPGGRAAGASANTCGGQHALPLSLAIWNVPGVSPPGPGPSPSRRGLCWGEQGPASRAAGTGESPDRRPLPTPPAPRPHTRPRGGGRGHVHDQHTGRRVRAPRPARHRLRPQGPDTRRGGSWGRAGGQWPLRTVLGGSEGPFPGGVYSGTPLPKTIVLEGRVGGNMPREGPTHLS